MVVGSPHREVERETEAGAAACPHLRVVHQESDLVYPHGVSCVLRHGPARAPSADELAWFCTNGRHHGCVTYRRWRQMGEVS